MKETVKKELILSSRGLRFPPVAVATFNSHSSMSGDELTLMLSLDSTSSTLALGDDDDDDAAAADGLPMIPKQCRNAGGHTAPSTPSLVVVRDEDTAGRCRHLWSISLVSGRENNSKCRCLCVAC